jgi:hypothetical protein
MERGRPVAFGDDLLENGRFRGTMLPRRPGCRVIHAAHRNLQKISFNPNRVGAKSQFRPSLVPEPRRRDTRAKSQFRPYSIGLSSIDTHVGKTPETTNRRPPVGDERCQARGTTPLRHALAGAASARDDPCESSRRPANGGPCRRRLLSAWFRAVRGEAPRSYSPVSLVPHHSQRGSLARFHRVLVLINACRVSS